MYSYTPMCLWLLILSIATSKLVLANEHEISENDCFQHVPYLETQAAAPFKYITDSELNGKLSIELFRSVRFEPTQLDFGVWSVGTLRSLTVTLLNKNGNHSVYLNYVSGRTPSFFSSFFDVKVVPPNGNTTFNVIFLPREQGAISSTLNIHTSFGKLGFKVHGIGRECPYRLKPLVGIRAPLNATLMPEIHMYNPHKRALQILEVYSSGGQFLLELPSGDTEAPKGLWEIPPLTSKPVIRIRFQGYAADSLFTGGDGGISKKDEHVLVVPVEIEILSQYGVYAVNPLFEFGRMTVGENSPLKIIKQNILLKHSKSQLEVNDLKVKSVTHISGVFIEGCQVIALHPNEVQDPVMRLNKKLEIYLIDKKEHTYHVELIIRADIFKGNLFYDVNKTLFIIPKKSGINIPHDSDVGGDDASRVLTMRNDFKICMAIYNVSTQNSDPAKLSLQFESGIVLQPGTSFDILVASNLYKQQEQDLKDLINYKTAIYVYTNITNFEIPIVITSARLFVTTQTLSIWRPNASIYTKELDLGSIPIRETSTYGFVIVQNRNSIPIILKMVDFQKPQRIYYHVLYLGCIKADVLNGTNNYTVDLEKADYKFTSDLNEGDIAVYMLDLQPYTTELSSAFLILSTPFENITIHVKFSTILGRLEVDQEKLHFPNCFPGKLCSSELSIRSTFKQPIHIKYINFTDSGFRFEDKYSLGSKIAAQSVTTVGRIYFRPSALCGSRCYIQEETDESVTFPRSVIKNSLNMPNFDEGELRRRTELYRHFKYYFQNVDFTMTTQDMQHFQLTLMIELEWPQLVSGRTLLPTIEVNKKHIYEVKISNPSDNPIIIDYTLADPTLAKQTRISLPLEVVVITPSCYLTDKAVFSFVHAPPKKPILIPGLSSIKVQIKLQADFAGTICTLLHIRNNLTLYEGVWISAKAVQSQFRLGNRKPGSQTPLLFEISEKYLASACPASEQKIIGSRTDQHYVIPQVVSRHIFTARNSGELPIKIDNFWIENQPCQAFGFQVMNCSSFELMTNSSKKIEIVFQSDFSVTRITRILTLKTNLSYAVNYILVAQLPSNGLEYCEFLLPRPPWEQNIRNAAIITMLLTFCLVVIAVHIDYSNIIYNQSVLYEAREKGTVYPTFNLRNIATRSMQNNIGESVTMAEMIQRNKTKASPSGNNDSSSTSPLLGLKKRNVKSAKALHIESKPINFSTRRGMTLAEMVSWTFGRKASRKYVSNTKNYKIRDQSNSNVTNSTIAISEMKISKSKLNEKVSVEKMDCYIQKTHIIKKPKISDRSQAKNNEKIGMEEVKLRREEKNSPHLQTKTIYATETAIMTQDDRERRKVLDLTIAQYADKSQNSLKENANGRKLGKTPGRERRKQSFQNNSPVVSDVTSSSSTSSSCSSSATAKHNERKSKVKPSNSLKFNKNSTVTELLSTSFSTTCSPTSISGNISKTENTNATIDILSPWDCGIHPTFSNVLQKSQSQLQQSTISSDLLQQGSLFDLIYPTLNGIENSEITAALTPKRSKRNAADLGPIGSRKSPLSTPVWEPVQTAITMQVPTPLNATIISTSPTGASPTTSYYPRNSSFGFNDLAELTSSSIQQQQQQQQDIHVQLLALQRKLLEQQHSQHQQQQQFLNSNTLNHSWADFRSPLWSPTVLNELASNTDNNSSIFSQPQTENVVWNLTPNSSSSSPNGLVRPPPGLEQNFSNTNNLTISLNSHQISSSTAVTSVSTFNNTTSTVQSTASDNDNMAVFNLFGGLSSIWNETWKNTTSDQEHHHQQSSQNPQ